MATISPALAALTLLSGCSETTEGSVLLGWQFDWTQLSHRVAYVDVDMPDDGSVEMGMIGGDYSTGDEFSDTVLYRANTLAVTSSRAAFASAEVTLEIEPASEGSGFTAAGAVSFDGEAVGDWPDYTAFVSGFTLDTDLEEQGEGYSDEYDPALGYTSLGFGVWLDEVEVGDSSYEVPVTVRFAHGPSGEEDVPGITEGREAMDASIPHARTAVRVRVTLVGYKGDRDDLSLEESVALAYDPPYSVQSLSELPAVSESGRTAVPGWRGFNLVVNGGEGNHGDYLRSFGAILDPGDALDEGLDGTVTAGVTGTSAFELAPMTYDFTGDLAVLHLKDTEVSLTQWGGEAEIGDWVAEVAQ